MRTAATAGIWALAGFACLAWIALLNLAYEDGKRDAQRAIDRRSWDEKVADQMAEYFGPKGD